jgi:hypothetical protein
MGEPWARRAHRLRLEWLGTISDTGSAG